VQNFLERLAESAAEPRRAAANLRNTAGCGSHGRRARVPVPDMQSRTLSGGEVSAVHLTRALGRRCKRALRPRRAQRRAARQGPEASSWAARTPVEMGNSVVNGSARSGMIPSARSVGHGSRRRRKGGEVVYQGTPEGLAGSESSLTGAYLSGRMSVVSGRAAPRATLEMR